MTTRSPERPITQPLSSSPNARLVYVGSEEQVVIIMPGHASDLVRRPLNHIGLSIHFVEVI